MIKKITLLIIAVSFSCISRPMSGEKRKRPAKNDTTKRRRTSWKGYIGVDHKKDFTCICCKRVFKEINRCKYHVKKMKHIERIEKPCAWFGKKEDQWPTLQYLGCDDWTDAYYRVYAYHQFFKELQGNYKWQEIKQYYFRKYVKEVIDKGKVKRLYQVFCNGKSFSFVDEGFKSWGELTEKLTFVKRFNDEKNWPRFKRKCEMESLAELMKSK